MSQNPLKVEVQQAFNNATLVYQGQMLTTAASFSIVKLDQGFIPEIYGLHLKSIAALKDDEKAFLLEKPKSFFENHFSNAAGNTVLGIVCNDNLIGQSIILNPNAAHPDTGMTDMAPVGAPETITVLQGVSVLPEYRNNKLMHQMVHAWLNDAMTTGKHHALAEVEVHNIGSWSAFLNEGMQITSIGVDPDDGALLYNVHETLPEILKKRLTNSFNKAAENSTICPINDFKTQQDMLANGHVISGWKKDTKEFILTPKM